MANRIAIASLALAGALPLALPTPASGQAGRTSKPVSLCLPPGGSPTPCGTARAGQTIRLQVATTSLPREPINLLFTEESAAGRAPRSASVVIAPTVSRDGGYEVTVPGELCAGTRGSQGQFEIQRLMSTYNQSETTSRSLGTMTIAC